MKLEIAAINLITLDLIYSGIHRLPGQGEEVATNQLTLALGGGPAASAVTAARLGAPVRLATSLGLDYFSLLAQELLAKEGIPYRSFAAQVRKGMSPVNVTSVMTIQGADRSFLSYFPDTDFYSAPPDGLLSYVGECAFCIASGPDAKPLRRLREKGCKILYDVGWSDDLSLEVLRDVLSSVCLFAPNEKEARKLTGEGDIRQALLAISNCVPHPIVKLGKDGALLLHQGEILHIPPFEFSPVDSTGAGDAFLGGVAYGLVQGWDLPRCVELGNYTGGKATTQIGCLSSRASIEEFERLCKNR